VLERAVVIVVALAAAAFLATGFTAARAEDALVELQFRAPDVARAETLAERAGRATAGERRVLLLANLRLRSGDAAGASALLQQAVRREPANAEAWLGLSRAARATDPELARRAAQRLRALVPPVPPP